MGKKYESHILYLKYLTLRSAILNISFSTYNTVQMQYLEVTYDTPHPNWIEMILFYN